MQSTTIEDKNHQINYATGWYGADGRMNDFNQ